MLPICMAHSGTLGEPAAGAYMSPRHELASAVALSPMQYLSQLLRDVAD